jgi:hypothetical protein
MSGDGDLVEAAGIEPVTVFVAGNWKILLIV